ncbi:MAG: hypothetical protein AABY22_33255 [Nanoarchaeota archaeon]
MKSFLLKNNKPTILWSMLEDNCFYEGKLPKGNYSLAICSGIYTVLDVDCKNGGRGYDFIPVNIKKELDKSFFYDTKSGGRHYWILYTGNKILLNKSTKYFLDLRVGTRGSNNGGYIRYNGLKDIRQCVHLIKPSSKMLNKWLEGLFS